MESNRVRYHTRAFRNRKGRKGEGWGPERSRGKPAGGAVLGEPARNETGRKFRGGKFVTPLGR